jgi:hypothetical protein
MVVGSSACTLAGGSGLGRPRLAVSLLFLLRWTHEGWPFGAVSQMEHTHTHTYTHTHTRAASRLVSPGDVET